MNRDGLRPLKPPKVNLKLVQQGLAPSARGHAACDNVRAGPRALGAIASVGPADEGRREEYWFVHPTQSGNDAEADKVKDRAA